MGQQVITLGASTGVQATFGPEGLAKRFGKLFRKEIQTGDSLFDEHVHVQTDTEDETTKLLESEDLRTVIERVVSDGGAVSIDGAVVTIELGDGTKLEASLEAALRGALPK